MFVDHRRDARHVGRLARVRRRGPVRPTGDDGFTMVEMLVALAVIGIIMAALASYFVSTVSLTARQGNRQASVQLADDGVELAAALKGSAVVTGRDKTSSDVQWSNPVAGVSAYLTDMTEAYDPSAPSGSGATATLPTTGVTSTVNNLVYTQNWYVGTCYQPSGGGSCGTTNLSGYVTFYRVVVAVTWTDKICASSQCSFITSTLISNASSEPIFNTNLTSQAPTVTNPGNQTGDAAIADTLQLTASGGAGTITWGGSQLPPGLSISTGGLISGSPTTAGTYTVTITATDTFGLTGTAVFNWTVNAALAVTTPATQTDAVTEAASLIPTSTGGTGSLTWSATGLPAGITINASSGNMTGTPTTAATNTVVLKAVDSQGQSSSVTFSWVINPVLSITTPAAQSSFVGVAITTLSVVASNGAPSYTWSASGLPAGLSISSSTGQITGTPTTAGTYSSAKVTVTDADSKTVSTSSFTWTVTVPLAITSPTANQASTKGKAIVSLTTTSTGGSGTGYTYSATGLPTGLAISSGGVISGTPTVAGSYSVVLKVTDSASTTDTQALTWTVNSAVTVAAVANQASTKSKSINSVTATSSGGTGTITWSASGLPGGLSISSSTGVISGTPSTTTGSPFSVTVTATDSLGATGTTSFTWTINALIVITNPTANQTSDKSTAITSITTTTTGGTGAMTWSATGLPTGITINASTGVISGTPTTTTGSPFSVVITATDSVGATDTQALTWTINTPPAVAAIANQSTIHGHAATTVTPVGSGGTTAYVWTATGMPAGIVINASTGKLTGTPTTAGTYTVKVTLTDAVGATASSTFTWTVT